MFKDKRVLVAAIMILAAIAVVFAIVTNGTKSNESNRAKETSKTVKKSAKSSSEKSASVAKSAKTSSKQDQEKSPSSSNKDSSSSSSSASASSSSSATDKFDVTAALKSVDGAPAVLSTNIGATSAQVVLADNASQDFDAYTGAYAKSAVAILKAAAKTGKMTDIYVARQVKLEDGTEFAIAGYWTGDQLKNAGNLADNTSMKDLLLNASRYYIGGSVWGTFSQQQKNDYTNHQQGGQIGDNQDFTKWVTSGTTKQ
ncbi:hypothetical protein [Weissella cibaria]|uniref:hypothetical protein n=1 Tax=Weissella cibaria TaxID=137591 RepID=UPI000BFFA29C|nr:hypothetical protein [Weissella cibaria]